MNNTVTLYKNKFEKGLKQLAPKDVEAVQSERAINEHGVISGSCLLVEIGQLSSFFMDDKIKKLLSLDDACVSAFYGWKLSIEYFEKTSSTQGLTRCLDKYVKKVSKSYKNVGIKMALNEIRWLILCCAFIKYELYRDFKYDMLAFLFDDGVDDQIKVIFRILENNSV